MNLINGIGNVGYRPLVSFASAAPLKADVQSGITEPQQKEEKKSSSGALLLFVLVAGAGGFAYYWFKVRKAEPKEKNENEDDDDEPQDIGYPSQPEADYFESEENNDENS